MRRSPRSLFDRIPRGSSPPPAIAGSIRTSRIAASIVAAAVAASLSIGCVEEEAGPDQGYVETADVRLYYRVLGSGADTLLVLHGGPGAGMHTVLPDTRFLADPLTLIYYDQRGGGRSSLPADTGLLTARAFVDDLDAVRAHFGIERMNVFAHSFGAVLLAEYARSHPDRLRRVVLHAPTGPSRREAARRAQNPGEGEPEPDSTLLRRYRTVLQMLLVGSADRPREACRTYERLGRRIAAARGDTASTWNGTECEAPPESIRYYFHRTAQLAPRSFGDWDYTSALGDVESPALVIHGERDALALPADSSWAAAYPNGRLLVVPGAARGAIAARPRLVGEAIVSFVREK